MKKLVTLILIGIIAVTFGCVTTSSRGGNPCKNLSTRFDQARYEKLATVWQWDTFNQRGFVTIEEINEVMRLLDPPGFAAKIPYGKQNKTITWCYNHVSKLLRLVWLVDYDLLPYEAMMFLAIEKEDYQEAEHIKKEWLSFLYEIQRLHRFEKSINPFFEKNNPDIEGRKFFAQLRKAESIVGLTDPLLIKLRKGFMEAVDKENWDDAHKIQSLIESRTKDIRPQEKQQIIVSQPSNNIIMTQPSSQHITVENVPRYGFEDVGRAMSLLNGSHGRITSKEKGVLKSLDIIFKR